MRMVVPVPVNRAGCGDAGPQVFRLSLCGHFPTRMYVLGHVWFSLIFVFYVRNYSTQKYYFLGKNGSD